MIVPTKSLSIRGLHVRYGSEVVLNSIDLPEIPPNAITVFAGPNGAGKSTLLKALAGLIPARGTVCWGAHDLLAMSAKERASGIGFMPQTIAATDGLTVLESVLASARAFAPLLSTAQREDDALSTLERVGILEHAMKPLGRLSGGQRQLASLAQSLVRNPQILLLDEPTSALDLRHQIEVMTVLRSIAASGRVVIVVLHDLALAANWADHLVLLHEGRVAGVGDPTDVVTSDLLRQVYGVNAKLDRGPEGQVFLAVNGLQ
jgi:iron complex transport system ATP-binding protein